MTYTVSSGTLNPSIPYHTIDDNHNALTKYKEPQCSSLYNKWLDVLVVKL